MWELVYTFEDLKWDNCPFRIFRYCPRNFKSTPNGVPFEIFAGLKSRCISKYLSLWNVISTTNTQQLIKCSAHLKKYKNWQKC